MMSNLPQVKTSSLATVELTCLDLIKILSANPHFFLLVVVKPVKPLKMTSRVLNIEGFLF